MSTTQTTTGSSNLQFNPIAQGIYNQLISGGGNVLNQYMTSPLSNPFYNLGAAQSQRGAQQAGANNMSALMQNMLTSGIGGQAGAGFKQAQMAQTGRANQSMSSQANIQNVLAALQRQMSAAGTGLSFSPQLTGSKSSSSTSMSGLGTWLPQLLSAAGGAAMGAATGGFGGAGSATTGYTPGTGPGNVGSIGGVPAPQLGSPSYMPMAGMGSGGLTGMIPGGGGGMPPFPFPGMFGNQ